MHRPDGSSSTDKNQGERDIKTNLITDNYVHEEVELPKLETAGWEHKTCKLLARGQAILPND